jgi:hypothetical protein
MDLSQGISRDFSPHSLALSWAETLRICATFAGLHQPSELELYHTIGMSQVNYKHFTKKYLLNDVSNYK